MGVDMILLCLLDAVEVGRRVGQKVVAGIQQINLRDGRGITPQASNNGHVCRSRICLIHVGERYGLVGRPGIVRYVELH